MTFVKNLLQGLTHRIDQHDGSFRTLERLKAEISTLDCRIKNVCDIIGGNEVETNDKINDLANRFDKAMVELRCLVDRRHKAHNTRIYKERMRLKVLVDELNGRKN